MKELRITLCALALSLATVLMVGPGRAQDPATGMGLAGPTLASTAFTYQGRLRDGAGPVNGVCDFTFWLYNAPSGGSPLSAVPMPGVDVSDGYFIVVLDFGAGAFDGQDRWLEIEVDCDGAATTLSPRQELTPAPYGLYASAAPWSGLTDVPPGFADGIDDDTIYTPGNQLQLLGDAFHVVEGAGSDLDADLLDGEQGLYYLDWSNLDNVPPGFADGIDDDTTYIAGTGLTLTIGTFSLAPTYRLPQSCADGQVTKWESGISRWVCGDDNVSGGGAAWLLSGNAGTQYGLDALGTTDPVSLSLVVDSAPVLRLEFTGQAPNVVGGNPVNHVTPGAFGATIGGGGDSAEPNQVSDKYGTVGGGSHNLAGDGDGLAQDIPWATVGGGRANTASGGYATVGGGYYNLALGNYATIAGGGPSDIAYPDTTNNRVTDSYGTIGGGGNNQAGDGDGDVTNTRYATVGGGWGNTASGLDATVGGGYQNEASGEEATIGGGVGNEATGYAASVGGGLDNQATASFATIAGGGRSDVVDPTTANLVSDNYGTIGGGGHNQAGDGADGDPTDADYAAVGGGLQNTASGPWSTVGGGEGNTASDWHATVGGGSYNTASGWRATVGGGYGNTADSYSSTVAGGDSNTASGHSATIAGGGSNYATGSGSAIGGGDFNDASGDYATVGGGCFNDGSAYATVGGGSNNWAGGTSSTVPGGYWNSASGNYSFAAGTRAKATHTGAFLWADSNDKDFTSTANDSFGVRSTGGARFVLAIDGSGTPTWTCSVSNGGSWSCSSDRNLKRDLLQADGRQVLEVLAQMPVYYWTAVGDDTRHIGPMAQDFAASFAVGESDTAIDTIDLDGVALAAIQGLYELSEAQAARIEALEAENAALQTEQAAQQEQLDDLAARLAALEAGEDGASTPSPSSLLYGLIPVAGISLVALGFVYQQRKGGVR
jgi:FtsZ-binding cell division protein ZapB